MPDLRPGQQNDETVDPAERHLIAFPQRQNQLVSRRLKCLKFVPVKKRLLRMTRPTTSTDTPPDHHLVDAPLLRTGTD